MTTNHSPTPQHRDPYAPPPGGHVIHRLARLLLFFVGLAACLTASLVFYASWRQSQYTGQVRVSPGNSQLNPAEYFYLQTYLGLHAAELA